MPPRCRHSRAPIRITTRDRGRALAEVEPGTAVVWLSVRYEGECAANSLCAVTAFFCTDDHLAAWRRERHSDDPGFRMSIDEALEVGVAIFGPSLAGTDAGGRQGHDAVETQSTPRPSSSTALKNKPMGDHRLSTNGRNGGSYDLAVIGAGSAGFSAAITAADLGAQVALIGSGTIGGTCVNIGCVPSKTLIRAAEALQNARAAERFAGITAEAEVNDSQATVRQKDALVAELRRAKYADLLPAYNGVAYREGAARLAEGGVELDGTHIRAGKIITGSPRHPGYRSRALPHKHDGA
jgi:mercuric reductase